MTTYHIAALYCFHAFPDYRDWQEPLLKTCRANDIRGSLLLADEGINGTIAGPPDGLARTLAYIRQIPGFSKLEHKESLAERAPFPKLKVRLKKEIVSMGAPGLDPSTVGTYVAPEEWNALIHRDDVMLIDTRNDYEIEIGQFQGAVNPQTSTFRDFPAWAQRLREEKPNTKIAMYCTGGIRCEKASAYMKSIGFEEVYHLQGGILKYLEETPPEDSLWEGECFVFDERVSVGHGLTPGEYTLCRACGRAVSPEGRRHPAYEAGVQCQACVDEYPESARIRFRQRQQQYDRARAALQPGA